MSATCIPSLRRKPAIAALALLTALTFAMPVDAAGRHGVKKHGVSAAKAPAAKQGKPASAGVKKAKRRAKVRPAVRMPAMKSRLAPATPPAARIPREIAPQAEASPRNARQACLREGRIFLLANCQDSAPAVLAASSD